MRPIALSSHGNAHFPRVNIESKQFANGADWKGQHLFRWLCTSQRFWAIASFSTASIWLWFASSGTCRCHGHCHRTFSPTAWSAFACLNRIWTAFWRRSTASRCSNRVVAYPGQSCQFQWRHTTEILVQFRHFGSFPPADGANRYRIGKCTAVDRKSASHFHTTFEPP